jgi:hypothetical protein
MDLLLRPTVIAGDKLPNDFCVIHEGRTIGRIRLAEEQVSRGAVWCWRVNPPLPIPSWCNGTADNLDAAKAEFKAAWERFYSSLSPERIRRWHLIEDMGTSNDWWLE